MEATLKIYLKEELYFWGFELAEARESLGLSQAEFAEKCGWTQQYQSQLELPGIKHRLSLEKREVLMNVGISIFPAPKKSGKKADSD